MRQVPAKCPGCGEHNIHNLDYCAVCGAKFHQRTASGPPQKKKAGSTSEQKLKAKRVKKRKELTELYKRRKITVEQYSAGLRKLGYSTDMDKAEAFKKYIGEQIKAFEQMKMDPHAKEGESYFDPNASTSHLPRDEFGNVITDFSIGSDQSSPVTRPTEAAPMVDHGAMASDGTGGPRFGMSLFGDRGPGKGKRVVNRPLKRARIDSAPDTARKGSPRRRKAMADWDDDEEEVIVEEEIEMDMTERGKGESGWWDDEKWELEWTDEDEDEFDDWEVDLDEEGEEEGWILEFDEDEESEEPNPAYDVTFDDDENDDYDITFEEDGGNKEEDGFEVDDDEGEDIEIDDEKEEDEDEGDWSRPRRRRRNR